jgi:hypothetical protein
VSGAAKRAAAEEIAGALAAWAEDPGAFVREALGVAPEPWQAEVLEAIARGHKRLAVRSGHGVGKTALEAWLVLWFGVTREGAKIPATAPTAHQLNDLMWGEIAKWRRALKERFAALAEAIEITAERVDFVPWRSTAFARTSRPGQSEALQGFHAENLLFIADEASGIDERVFEVAEGTLSTPGALIVLAGNPTRAAGFFLRAFTRDRARWWTRRVACQESGLVAPDYIAGMKQSYGEDSNVYRVRVLGEFPRADDDGVIPLDLAEAAVLRDVEPVGRRAVWGLDVARFGDDATALAKRAGNALVEPVKTWRNKDTMQVAGLVQTEWDTTAPKDRPGEIVVDAIGIGAGVADRLRELGLPARGVNVAEQPARRERYLRLRDELWFLAREWLAARDCRLARDEALVAELTGPRYSFDSQGRLRVEAKEEMKRRGLASPDRADAFCLTFAGLGAAAEPGWGRPTKTLDLRYVV